MSDDGTFDGVEPIKPGSRTSTREWLEQVIPNLLNYPLQDSRVHEVVPDTPSAIPLGKVVLVVDVGDSALAPHQTAVGTPTYFQREGGHSVPAKHFYLEMLRNRLVGPSLKAELTEVRYVTVVRQHNEWMFVHMRPVFRITNTGRVAAYKWALSLDQMGGFVESRAADYKFDFSEFPPGCGSDSNIRLDTTILPTLSMTENRNFGVYLRPRGWNFLQLSEDFRTLVPPTFLLRYRAVSETSPGELVETTFEGLLNYDDIIRRIGERC